MDADHVRAAHEGQPVDAAFEIGADELGAAHLDSGEDDGKGQDLALLPAVIDRVLVPLVRRARILRVGRDRRKERRGKGEKAEETHERILWCWALCGLSLELGNGIGLCH